ncbi:MAG: twin-arginine translocase subunit TatC [Bacteroidales bacterium]|nr:twin-arginine translocase subunit TatC [Bacteroidales bacterium]
MSSDASPSFWDHLDELRSVIIRSLIVWAVCFVVLFVLKKVLFTLLFAPATSDFISYRLMCRFSEWLHIPALCPDAFDISFINVELSAQFVVHIQAAFWGGLLLASPYIVYQLYSFVLPALYDRERRYASSVMVSAILLFLCGVLLNYFIIFPFTFRFLSTYQVYEGVVNQISLTSYIGSILSMSLIMGLLFEIPIVAYFLARMGVVTADMLRHYRRHAIVAIVILAAVITPTGDAFTLMLVSVPIWLLYELSVMIVKRNEQT